MAARTSWAPPAALIVANPVPADQQLDPALHDRVLAEALAAAERAGIAGKAVTPFLLGSSTAPRRGEPGGQRPHRPAQRGARRADRRRVGEGG